MEGQDPRATTVGLMAATLYHQEYKTNATDLGTMPLIVCLNFASKCRENMGGGGCHVLC